MKNVFGTVLFTAAIAVSSATVAFAHTPLCSCFDNGDGTITCEGGFSDGSTASGVAMYVKDASDAVLVKGEMSEESTFDFKKPEGKYSVFFDAGEGHQITIDGADIVE